MAISHGGNEYVNEVKMIDVTEGSDRIEQVFISR